MVTVVNFKSFASISIESCYMILYFQDYEEQCYFIEAFRIYMKDSNNSKSRLCKPS